MSYSICAIPGDGIGREVVPAAVTVLQRLVPDLHVEWADGGFETWQRTGESIPEDTRRLVEETDATLFGAVSSPLQPTPGYKSAIITLRRAFELYACVRPIQSLPTPQPALESDTRTRVPEGTAPEGAASSNNGRTHPDPLGSVPFHAPSGAGSTQDERRKVNLIIFRENTEGLYGGGEESDGERAVARRVITRAASLRIARLAFETARRQGRRRVTIVHKANVLPKTCGLFRAAAFEVARDYPEITADEGLVDSVAMRLAGRPEAFDVIVTTNLFGDILSDIAAIHGGGLGLAPSANIGDRAAVFEPVHGSAPDIAGRGIANPLAAILAGAMLLDHIGLCDVAVTLRAAVDATLAGPVLPPDLGGTATTNEVVDAVLEALDGRAAALPGVGPGWLTTPTAAGYPIVGAY